MDVTKPYEFIGFGAVDVTKPCGFIRFGAMDGIPGSRVPTIQRPVKGFPKVLGWLSAKGGLGTVTNGPGLKNAA